MKTVKKENLLDIRFQLPRNLLTILETQEEDLARKVKEIVVLGLFRENRISSGKGAEFYWLSIRTNLLFCLTRKSRSF